MALARLAKFSRVVLPHNSAASWLLRTVAELRNPASAAVIPARTSEINDWSEIGDEAVKNICGWENNYHCRSRRRLTHTDCSGVAGQIVFDGRECDGQLRDHSWCRQAVACIIVCLGLWTKLPEISHLITWTIKAKIESRREPVEASQSTFYKELVRKLMNDIGSSFTSTVFELSTLMRCNMSVKYLLLINVFVNFSLKISNFYIQYIYTKKHVDQFCNAIPSLCVSKLQFTFTV